MCIQPMNPLTPTEVATLARLEQDAEAVRVVTLMRRFGDIVRERSVTRGAELINIRSSFKQWLGKARTCGVRGRDLLSRA